MRPDLNEENPIQEPPDLEEFYTTIKNEFKHASTNYLADLHAFRGLPKESLIKLSSRFDEVADPLLTHKHMALHFVNHIPAYIRWATVSETKREDKKRRKAKVPLVAKDELLRMAKENEAELLESEAEQRAAALTPPPRDIQVYPH